MDGNTNSQLEIKVNLDLVNYLQMLDYEAAGLKILHTHAVQCDLPKEKVDKIKQEFIDKYNEFMVAKSEIEKEYLKDMTYIGWRIDYNKGVLYVQTR